MNCCFIWLLLLFPRLTPHFLENETTIINDKHWWKRETETWQLWITLDHPPTWTSSSQSYAT